MSDSDQQQAEKVSEWPENGGEWSDEDGPNMDCGLLQAMAEEDEEINVYNEETFGMDLDAHETPENSSSGLLRFEKPPPPPTTPPDPIAPLHHSSPSPPRQRPRYLPCAPTGQRGGGRGQRRGLGRGQMFEDPAVMRIVQGRPSLKGLDSAIVDCGKAMFWNSYVDDFMVPSSRKTRRISGSLLQDSAIVCVIDGHRGQHMTSNFLEIPYPVSSFRGRRGDHRGYYPRRQFSHRGPSQMHVPVGPGSPILSRQPLTPRQHYSQTGSFMFPMNPRCPSTPQSLTPKMMQLRFGANSPRPSPFYSPSSNSVQHFRPNSLLWPHTHLAHLNYRYPGPVTQLHPQHKRLLNQKQRTFPRKAEGWDPYCNLMTAKEKEWITRLQMIQLQSERPYFEDYYYQEYYRRIEAKMAEEELGIRGKREPPKLTTPYITKTDSYTPELPEDLSPWTNKVVHIEGSLGQVAVSTCYSPRRAIGAVHAVQAQGPVEEQKDIRRQRLEILSKIEKVEESDRMKTTVLSEMEEKRLMEEKQKKVDHIYSQVQRHNPQDSGEEFLPFLLVAKGKRLIGRLLPFLKRDAAFNVLRIMTSNLPLLMSRDTEEALPLLYPPLRNVIGGLSFSQLISVLKDLSLTSNESLMLACQNKFGLSLLYALLSQGEKLLSSGVPLEPSIGDFETWTDSIFQVAGQLTQCSLVEPLLLPSNLLTLFCRYLDKRTVHQLKSNMESATGFLALPS